MKHTFTTTSKGWVILYTTGDHNGPLKSPQRNAVQTRFIQIISES